MSGVWSPSINLVVDVTVQLIVLNFSTHQLRAMRVISYVGTVYDPNRAVCIAQHVN